MKKTTINSITIILLISFFGCNNLLGQTFFQMSNGNYAEDFSDISSWTNNYLSGTGSNYWRVATSVSTSPVNTETVFTSGTAGGVQKGNGKIVLLATGTNSTATDLLFDFSNRSAGTITFDWEKIVNNASTNPRTSDLKIMYSIDNGVTFSDVANYTIPRIYNNTDVETSSITNLQLPSEINNISNVVIRFYAWNNGQTSGSGNRPKFAIDNIQITSNSIPIETYNPILENNELYLSENETQPLKIQSKSYNKNTIINYGNNSNVGIGTNNPMRKLHVKSIKQQNQTTLLNGINGSNSNNDIFLPISVPFDTTKIGISQMQLDSLSLLNQQAGSMRLEIQVVGGSNSAWDIRPVASDYMNVNYHKLIFSDVINSHTPMALTSNGNLGIGTMEPLNKLHVSNGNILISGKNTHLLFGDGLNNNYGGGDYGIEYIQANTLDNNKSGLNFWKPFGSSQGQFTNFVFHLADDGNVGIGNGNPIFKLDVNGIIRSNTEVIVCTDGYCDFVFDKDYILEPFESRILKIKTQKHLPNIKPASDVIQNGIPISETVKGLLQNIEELYLYLDKMETRIKQLEEENKLLKNQ